MATSIQKLVKIVNQFNKTVYLPVSGDDMETKVIPPKGSMTVRLTEEQLALVKAKGLQFNVKGQ